MSTVREKSIWEMGKYFEQSMISHLPTAKVIETTEKAVKYNMAGVYCKDHELDLVKSIIKGTDLFAGIGISFPFGTDGPKIKAYAAEYLFERGATNLDFVMNYRALIEGKFDIVEEEVERVRKAAPEAVLKMIIECCYLNKEQIDFACDVAIKNRIDFIKTSTGQNAGPTFAQACQIVDRMHAAGLRCKVAGVKAPRPQNAMVYLLTGVDRIGSQGCVEIIEGIQEMRDRGIFG